MPEDRPEIIPPKGSRQSERTYASRLRLKARAGTATPEELAWLDNYDRTKEDPGRPSRAASARRRVSYTEEESAAAGEGEGVAAVYAHAAMAREEGRREDSLADRGIAALERAFARQEKLVDFMMARMQMLEDSHLEMWGKHRDSRMRETEAEIALVEAQAAAEGKGDEISTAVTELLPHILKQIGKGK